MMSLAQQPVRNPLRQRRSISQKPATQAQELDFQKIIDGVLEDPCHGVNEDFLVSYLVWRLLQIGGENALTSEGLLRAKAEALAGAYASRRNTMGECVLRLVEDYRSMIPDDLDEMTDEFHDIAYMSRTIEERKYFALAMAQDLVDDKINNKSPKCEYHDGLARSALSSHVWKEKCA